VVVVQVRFFRNRAGQRIAYSDEGEGPLVLLPAWWVSHLERNADDPAYCRFFARLTGRLRVVRYDRVGVGLSDRVRTTFTLESEVDDLAALVEHLGATRFHLLAFSCGGPVALAYAAQHPERVDRIVLYGSYLAGATLSTGAIREALVALVRADGRLGSGTLADIFHPTGDVEARKRFNALHRAGAEPEMAARLLELTYALDARPFVDRVRAPVLVLHRKNDVAVGHEQARTLCASLPDAVLTTLPGAAHFPWFGDADGLADAIVGFLVEVEGRPAGPAGAELRRDGEVWRLRFGGRSALVRDCKGLVDLVRLLDRPGEEIHVLDLLGVDASERRDGDRGDVTADREALAAYRRRLGDIDDDLADAEARADLGRARTLTAERDALLRQLAADTGRRGRARRLNDPVERARKTVTARLRDAIRRVKAADRTVGEHLEGSVRTGVHCAYRPDRPMAWAVSLDAG
jgi:pimeloyl-ACP methyl ester carboxylesterase